MMCSFLFFFFQAEDGIRDLTVTGVQTCALPISVAHAKFKSLLGFGELLPRLPLQGDIADGTEDQDAVLALEGAKTDFYGEFRAIFAASKKLHAGTHHAQTGSFGVLLAMPQVEIGRASCRGR